MNVSTQPLNQELKRDLLQWLDNKDCYTFRRLLRAKIAQQKQVIVEKTIDAVAHPQMQEDALAAAREIAFYERVLTLLAAAQTGHNPDTREAFSYEVLERITDEEPLTTE